MRLKKIQEYLSSKGWEYTYNEEDGLGSLDFEYRGINYHVWEFQENGRFGAESNVQNGGYQEDFSGDYETDIIEVMKHWK